MASEIRVNSINNRSGLGTITVADTGIVVSGLITATTFSGNIIGVAATFTGNVSIAGTLTYEDVTNVDSIGLITARSGVVLTGGNVTLGTGVTVSGSTANTFTLSTNGSERARIDSSGRLLVGTSTGRNVADTIQSTLQVEGTSYNSISVVNNTNDIGSPALKFGKSRGTTNGSNTVVQNGDYLGAINFAGANGTNLENIAGSIACIVDATPGVNDMPGRLIFSTTADGASSPTERMRIAQNGQVSIGVNSVSGFARASLLASATSGSHYGIHVNATGAVSATLVQFSAVTTDVGNISTNGTSSVSYNTTSDYRLKENVASVTDSINRLQQLNPCRFNFIADPSKTIDGFIAHEVQNVVPEAITGEKDAVDADGNPVYQGIDQSKLVPLLTAALQEAVAKIESLEARLTAAGI